MKSLRQGALNICIYHGIYGGRCFDIRSVSIYKRVAANYGRASSFHVRLLGNNKPPYEGNLGNMEQMANAAALGAPMLNQS